MTIRRCDKCAEYDKEDKDCQLLMEHKNCGNTCIEWVDDKERIENTHEINAMRGHKDISLADYRRKYDPELRE